MPQANEIFDRKLLRLRRDRSAKTIDAHDFMLRESAERLLDCLRDIARSFSRILVLGDSRNLLAPALQPHSQLYVQTDISCKRLGTATGLRVNCDEERLPFAEHSFDLVLCLWNLHWVNDLPGTLIQINHCLQPDGLFLAVFPGGESLCELRESLLRAAGDNGVAPHVSPFVEIRDAGGLLQRAGFALPVADRERLTVTYEHLFSLLQDLRGMGESNALQQRHRGGVSQKFWQQAATYCHKHFADDEGRIPATFELMTLTGWRPHASQQQPARRGSGEMPLETILKT